MNQAKLLGVFFKQMFFVVILSGESTKGRKAASNQNLGKAPTKEGDPAVSSHPTVISGMRIHYL